METKLQLKFKAGDRVFNKVTRKWVNIIEFDIETGLYIVRYNDGSQGRSLESELRFMEEEMIEGLVEEENKPKFKVGDRVMARGTNGIWEITNLEDDNLYTIKREHSKYTLTTYGEFLTLYEEFQLPEGYIFKDENGNEISANKIILEKVNTLKIQSDNMETETHRGYYTTDPETTSEGKKRGVVYFWDNDFADKVELDLSDRELIQEDGKWFVVKKKEKYPKTYEKCCRIVNANPCIRLVYNLSDGQKYSYDEDNLWLYESIRKLLICRDAFWKLYGEEMGLNKPWEPTMETVYCISRNNNVMKCSYRGGKSNILEFPTPEMRDTFYENFKEEIEKCKEFL